MAIQDRHINYLKIKQRLGQILGQENVAFGREYIKQYSANVTEYTQEIMGVVYPRHEQDLYEIFQLAKNESLALFPVSQGKNWGYGSRLPGAPYCLIIDFSRHMTQIIEINEELGYAVIQPGTTQGQLADYLESVNSEYMVDVTGSSRCSSIIGNCLERGVGFNSKRDETLLSLRILTGSGQFVNTSHDDSELRLHPPVCQPNITPLFVQSAFGFVCLAFIKLMRRSAITVVFNFIPHGNLNLKNLFKDLADLYNQGHLNCIFHLYDAQRLGTFKMPFLGKPKWFGVGNIRGSKGSVRAAKREISKRLRKHGRIFFYTESFIRRLRKILPFKKHMLELIASSVDIQQGKPKDTAVLDTFGTLDPDRESKKFFGFIVFAFPHTDTERFHKCFQNLSMTYDKAKCGVSINLLDAFFVEAVMSIEGKREDKEGIQYLQGVMDQIIQTLIQEGFSPYRLDIKNLKKIPRESSYQIVNSIKKILDPDKIIAPGKYSNS